MTVSTIQLMLEDSQAPAGTLDVTAPYDGTLIATVETAGEQHVDPALEVAYQLFRDRSGWLPLHRRIEILERAAEIIAERHEELSVQAAREGGKPLMDSRVELTRAIDGVRQCAEVIKVDAGEVIPTGTTPASRHRLAITRREPIGVVVAVSAFNHPFNLIVHQVGAAVAAGCPVIVKPAGDTPLSCVSFVEILREAGLPAPWCQVFIADTNESSERLVTDPRVAFFSFIGSARVGWMLRSKLAPGTRCALEHGGVAPVIVAPDHDRELALNSIVKGGFYHAGQVCVSVQRVYVPEDQAAEFAQELAELAQDLEVGDPTSGDTEVGPLIREGELKRVAQWVDEAVRSGARLICGGKAVSQSCYAPTVLLNPDDDSKVSQEEVFGPVVCVYGYDRIDGAIDRANSLPVAFQAAVFANDIDTAMRVYRRVDASAVMVNDHTAFRIDGMPFAGLKQSGLGVGGIGYTIEDMQFEKLMVIQTPQLP
ncbi:MAG: aldehyde dehydrogenase [Lysobacteraceae bacterium]|nr:MAG: aldehyde dehydrogenase [Xanthomonadaceae bacterium]